MEQGHSIAAGILPARGEFVEPILYLAECMAHQGSVEPPPARPIVDRLAEACGCSGFRERAAYQRLDEKVACEALRTQRARQGALVVLALVQKTDLRGCREAEAYFARIRERLQESPLAVPMQVQQHLALALTYLRD